MKNQNETISQSNKKVHFISLGCPKNLVDSEIMAGTLMNDGYSVVAEAEDADTVVVNMWVYRRFKKRIHSKNNSSKTSFFL